MQRLATIMTTCDSWQVTDECLKHLVENSNTSINRLILLDNGSYTKCPEDLCNSEKVFGLRFPENMGSNAVFHMVVPFVNSMFPTIEILGFIHNDVAILEPAWDIRVLKAFDDDPKLGCLGFIGSNETDYSGGRGLGTTCNWMGKTYVTGDASPAEVHGKRSSGLLPSATVDFCSMFFRKDLILSKLSLPEIPHHFYDRIWCLELLEQGYHIATLGIASDHFGGGIGMCKVPGEQVGVRNRYDCYKRFLDMEQIPYGPNDELNQIVYDIGEKIYLNKWREDKRFIPLKVNEDYSIEHQHPRRA
jgi:GT2 family glycosyltransferase